MSGRDEELELFERWWVKLQGSQSIAAWMIQASLPKGIARQIYFDARKESEERIKELEKDNGVLYVMLKSHAQEFVDKNRELATQAAQISRLREALEEIKEWAMVHSAAPIYVWSKQALEENAGEWEVVEWAIPINPHTRKPPYFMDKENGLVRRQDGYFVYFKNETGKGLQG